MGIVKQFVTHLKEVNPPSSEGDPYDFTPWEAARPGNGPCFHLAAAVKSDIDLPILNPGKIGW
jgi:hypothetical protein